MGVNPNKNIVKKYFFETLDFSNDSAIKLTINKANDIADIIIDNRSAINSFDHQARISKTISPRMNSVTPMDLNLSIIFKLYFP